MRRKLHLDHTAFIICGETVSILITVHDKASEVVSGMVYVLVFEWKDREKRKKSPRKAAKPAITLWDPHRTQIFSGAGLTEFRLYN